MEINFYQVEIKIPRDIREEFLEWLRGHMADMLALPTFSAIQLTEIIDQGAENKSVRYQAQYFYKEPHDFDRYLLEFAPKMRSVLPKEFSKVASFQRSLGTQKSL